MPAALMKFFSCLMSRKEKTYKVNYLPNPFQIMTNLGNNQMDVKVD